MKNNMQIVHGDLLSNTDGILVQGCNCHGKMGAGIAGVIRKKYPDVFKRYESLHAHSGLQLGTGELPTT
jgi:O-acetyl-ADP-ribose deacetylase (regulator of RNase III)